MDNNLDNKSIKNNDRRIKSIIFKGEILVLVAVIIIEFFLIIRVPTNYLAIIGTGLLLLLLFELVMDEVTRKINRSNEQKILQTEEYMKSQKAIYLANKRGFESIIKKLDEKSEKNTEEINNLFAGQKSIAKAIIRKNIESFDDTKESIVNAIDKSNDNCKLVRQECEAIKQFCEELVQKIDEISDTEKFAKIMEENMSHILKNEVQVDLKEEDTHELAKEVLSQDLESLEQVRIEPVSIELPIEETMVNNTIELDTSDPNKMMTPDDIAALLASMQ